MQAADTRIESSTESATAVRRGHIRKWRTRRVNLALCDARTHMHQERGTSAPRGSRNRTGKGVRLLRCPNACAPGAGGVSPPVVHGTAPARECDFCDVRTHMHQERGRQPPVVRGNARARAFASRSARLPTVHQRTPTQSRCYILDNIHGGLTRGALALGESLPACAWRFLLHARSRNHGGLTRGALVSGELPPACAWRFPLHARSPNHGGLTPAALVLECERLPAKLRLLRWTNARAPGAGGVSPPWFTVTHVQVRGTIVRGTSDRRTGERQRSHGTTTPTAGSRPPLLRRNANVCRRNCDFCDARTHMHRSGGRQPPVVYGNARAAAWRNCSGDIRPTHWRAPAQLRYSHTHCGLTRGALASECERLSAKLRLLRCTNAHAPGAGGVSSPWSAVTHLQRRGAIVRGTSDPHTGERQRSHGTATPTAGSRPPLLSPANRCLLVRGDFPCTRVLLTTAGSRPPLLCWNANVCRRNCHFCDARMHGEQKRGANA
jgi:hypothetical protein